MQNCPPITRISTDNINGLGLYNCVYCFLKSVEIRAACG